MSYWQGEWIFMFLNAACRFGEFWKCCLNQPIKQLHYSRLHRSSALLKYQPHKLTLGQCKVGKNRSDSL
jgi:hypothetical protein